jgi:choline dehydrogenase-like flavoprotein
MKNVIVVGSGAGGATVARELQGIANVTVLEMGGAFRPLPKEVLIMEYFRKTGLFLDERLIRLLMPNMRVRKTPDGMVLVNGEGIGGTTTLSAGNALRADGGLQKIGIDLDREFEDLAGEIPITDAHQSKWRDATNMLFSICEDLGLNPAPAPKMGEYARCFNCGRCVLGCSHGVKWDSRVFLQDAMRNGARLLTRCRVESVALEGGIARGIWFRERNRRRFQEADLVILAAGGLGTPVILERSGIPAEPGLFVDPVLCVSGPHRGSRQNRELSMPFIVRGERYIISPYFDYLSFFFNRAWRHPASDTLGLMVKLADTAIGTVTRKGITKPLTPEDRRHLSEGVEICRRILELFGIRRENMALGTVNAGHPGGTFPLTAGESETLHSDRLPPNLYIADASLFPESPGLPPILTIMALAKKVSRKCREML